MSLLELSGLNKRFGGLLAVSNFDLSLDAGEIVGLIGPNGAGKTTVFHLIAGFHEPTSGEIRFKGGSIVGSKPHAICRLGLTRTFQIVQPFVGLSVIENVMVGAFNRERDAVTASDSRSPAASPRAPRCCSSTRPCRGSTRRRSTRSSG
jgi:branched-chain amino acid transport system ATP-binding protein